jgi:hypothetical protein
MRLCAWEAHAAGMPFSAARRKHLSPSEPKFFGRGAHASGVSRRASCAAHGLDIGIENPDPSDDLRLKALNSKVPQTSSVILTLSSNGRRVRF